MVVVAPTLDQNELKDMLSADLATPDQSSTNQNKQVDTQAMPDVPTLIIQKTIRPQAEPAK